MTNEETRIGSYTLSSNATGGISNGQLGFVEYYPWNSGGSRNCSSLPWKAVTFGNPSTSTGGAVNGTIQAPYEYRYCFEKVTFQAQQTTNGFEVSVGFTSND